MTIHAEIKGYLLMQISTLIILMQNIQEIVQQLMFIFLLLFYISKNNRQILLIQFCLFSINNQPSFQSISNRSSPIYK